MTDRDAQIAAFLTAAGWGVTDARPLAGDASTRRYLRLSGGAVLMDAQGGDVRPFLAVCRHLASLGLSAPVVHAADEGLGLLLLEDFGDDLFARLIAGGRADEAVLYAAAVDLLAELAKSPAPGFVAALAPELVAMTAPAFDWYARGAAGATDAAAQSDFQDAFGAALAAMPDTGNGLILRDFHAENLIWMPARIGVARVGLLDFQDARAAPPVYDLVSLLEDARRDVGADADAAMRQRFAAATGRDRAALDHAAAVLALQRNLRILGVFARLSLHLGKPAYIDLIPRVWRHVRRNLTHPALARVAPVVLRALPEPSPAILHRLRSLCGTVPTP